MSIEIKRGPGSLPSKWGKAETVLHRLSLFTFGAMLILSPFRIRFVMLTRPIPPIYKDYTDFMLFGSDVFLLITLALWGVMRLFNSRRLNYGPIFLTIPIVGVILTGFISAIYSIDPALTLYHSIRLLLLFGLYLYIINEIHRIEELVLPVSLMLFVQAIVGIGQILRQQSIGMGILGELDLNATWHGVSVVTAGGIRSLRAYGLADHPNILGGCLAFGLVIIAGWYVTSKARWRTISTALYCLASLALFYTYSRSAWLAFISAMIIILALLYRSKRLVAARNWTQLVAACFIVLLPFLWQNASYLGVRLNSQRSFQQNPQENQSIGERLLLNNAANDIFANHPLTGVGLGAFPLALRDRYPDLPVDYQPAHFTLLDAAAEVGIFGALAYALAMTAPWLALWLNRKRLAISPPLITVTALLWAVSMVGFFDYYTWLLAPGRIWQYLAWGLWGLVYHSSHLSVAYD